MPTIRRQDCSVLNPAADAQFGTPRALVISLAAVGTGWRAKAGSPLTKQEIQMATKKNVSKTRKVTRAKATKKSSVRSGRKAPRAAVGKPTVISW